MKAAAVKYFAVFKVALKARFAEIYDILLHIVYVPLAVAILYFIWSIVFASRQAVQGFSFNDMMAYVIIALLIRRIIHNAWVSSVVERDITEGNILTFLCRPFNYLLYGFANRMGQTVIFAGIALPAIIITLIVFSQSIQALAFILALILIAIACFFTFLEFYCIGLLAFWFERVWGFKNAIDWLQEFVSGTFFPLTLLPLALQNISALLPFQYLAFTPAMLMLGKLSALEGVKAITILTAWSIALYAFSKWLWKKGLKKYDGKG